MTTYIKEQDVIQVASDLEIIITPDMAIEVLKMFDDEMATYPPSMNVAWTIVVQDLLNEFKTELSIIQMN